MMRGGNQHKKSKSEPDISETSEDGRTYIINRLTWGEAENELYIDCELLLAKCREGHTENEKDRDTSTKLECNVLSTF